MGFYLYCLVPPTGPRPEALTGIDGERVLALEENGLRLWCSEFGAAPTPSLERIREHHAVVRAAMEMGDSLLPMRFGQWLATRERLQERLRESGTRYADRFRAVSGAREFGVRVRDPDAPAPPAGDRRRKASSGREYLEALARREGARREVERHGKQIADELRERTEGLVREDRIHNLEPGWGIVSVAHLVDLEQAMAYRESVVRFREAHAELSVHVSGPWPPYSFAE